MTEYPQLLHTAIDTTDARALAEFYRQLLGLRYRQGDEPPGDGDADDADWLVLADPNGVRKLAFQQVERLERTTWPTHDVPMQMHLDFTVRVARSCRGSESGLSPSERSSCSIERMTRTSRSTSWRIPQATRSASSSPDLLDLRG